MGATYSNIVLRGPEPDEVLDHLRSLKRAAYVSPSDGSCVVVYDHDGEWVPEQLDELARTLSAEWRCPALATLNLDDSIFCLILYVNGEKRSEYASWFQCYCGGLSLCWSFGRLLSWPLVWALLLPPTTLIETFRHLWLVRLLGLPIWCVASGYEYISTGQLPEGLSEDDLSHTLPETVSRYVKKLDW